MTTTAAARRDAVAVVPGWAWAALALTAVLAAVGGRYGFHRDELYFVEAGRHPAWAYADQPALVPLLASAWYDAVRGVLPAFRLVPALAAGGVVAVAALTCRELGGDARARTWTAVVTASSTTLVAAGHLFGTTVFDVLATSALVLALLRAVRTGRATAWLLVGGLAALALLVKTLPATVLVCAVLALLLVGPRAPFRTPWAWAAAGVAALGLAPTLLWQGANGWPQLALAGAIADGGSGTSVDRALLLPMLPTLTGPLTAGVLVVGGVVLWRTPGRRWAAVSAVLLVLAVLATGGKPYYLLGVVPLLVAAGVPACLRWARRGPRPGRRGGLLIGLVVVDAVVGAFLALPLLPARLAPVEVVYDHGEQVGWDELTSTVGEAARSGGAQLVLAGNYGEAGALDRARDLGADLPPVVSGHNAYWWWGPPAGEPQTVLAVGRWPEGRLEGWFASCEQVGAVPDAGVDNDEAGAPLRLCEGPVRPWSQLWPQVQRLG